MLKNLLADPAGSWRAMAQSQRIALMVATAVLVSVAVVAYLWASAPTYVPLYTGLSSHSGGEVISALEKMNIPYRVGAGGAVIEVPHSQADSIRLKLAAKGLPSSGKVSFQSLSGEPLSTSSFVQRIQYQQALSTALSRTIESLSAVQSAEVTLAIPHRPVFMDDTRKPTASVLVELRPGASLGSRQVVGIQHLVASAVVGLTDKNVSVVDEAGNLLSGATDDPLGSGTGELGYQEQVERSLQEQVEALIAPIVGAKHVRVSVEADINYARVKTASVVYGKSHVLSEQWHQTSDGAGSRGIGIPGALSHIPPGAASAPISRTATSASRAATGHAARASSTSMSPQDQSRTVNFQNDHTVTEQVAPPGAIKKLSVAVLIDEGTVARQRGKKGKISKGGVPAREIKRITALVKNSIGFNAQRGDSVSVVAIPFAQHVAAKPAPASWWSSPLVPMAGKYLAGLFGLALLWFLFFRPVFAAVLGHLDKRGDSGGSGIPEHAGAAEAAVQEMAKKEVALAETLKGVREAIENDPAVAARIIRRWMSDEA